MNLHWRLSLKEFVSVGNEARVTAECDMFSPIMIFIVTLSGFLKDGKSHRNNHDGTTVADSWLLNYQRPDTSLVHPHRCCHLLCLISSPLRTVCLTDSSFTPLLVLRHLLGRDSAFTSFIRIWRPLIIQSKAAPTSTLLPQLG